MKETTDVREGRASSRAGFVGLSLVALGIAANRWTLERFFVPDGLITGNGKLAAIVVFQALCLYAGGYLLLRRLQPRFWARPPRALPVAILGAGVAFGAAAAERGLRAYLTTHDHTVEHGHHGAEATPEQRSWAEDFARRSREAAERNGWFDFEKAKADGFIAQQKAPGHYPNREFLFDDRILDPDRPEYLMYRETPRGKLLMGYMFFTRTLDERGPDLGGPLAMWHAHPWGPDGRCLENGIFPVSMPDENGECPGGTLAMRSPEMLHVWFVDHPLGPFAAAMDFPNTDSQLRVTMLHPALVHFTVALFTITVLLDVAGLLWKKPALHTTAWVNLALSAAMAIGTVIAGMAAEMNLLLTPEDHMALHRHKILGFALLGWIAVLAAWRWRLGGAFPARGRTLYLLLSVLGLALTVVTGHYGSNLVYVRGVGVSALDRIALERHEKSVFGVEESPASASESAHHGH
jgi:uncharacterized membrane protein